MVVAIDQNQLSTIQDLLRVYLRQYGFRTGQRAIAVAETEMAETEVAETEVAEAATAIADAMTVVTDAATDAVTGEISAAMAEELAAIAGAIVTWQARAQALQAHGLALEAWVQAVLQDFDVQGAIASGKATLNDRVVDGGKQAMVDEIHQWRQTLRSQVLDTLSAYLQDQATHWVPAALRPTVLTIVPLVADGTVTRAETEAIVREIQAQFEPAQLLDRVIDPTWRAIAAQVVTCLEHQSLETALRDTVHAFIQTHRPALVDIGERLVERLMGTVLDHRGEFNLDVAVDAHTQRLIVQQVSFKLHWLEASPPPSQSAIALAQQLDDEVIAFTRNRDQPDTHPATYTRDAGADGSSILGGGMEVGLTFLSEPQAAPAGEPPLPPEVETEGNAAGDAAGDAAGTAGGEMP
jgi:hypothetical protein